MRPKTARICIDKTGMSIDFTPNPGSDAAIDAGCTCPVMDNAHGLGVVLKNKTLFWTNADCPLHGKGVR